MTKITLSNIDTIEITDEMYENDITPHFVKALPGIIANYSMDLITKICSDMTNRDINKEFEGKSDEEKIEMAANIFIEDAMTFPWCLRMADEVISETEYEMTHI